MSRLMTRDETTAVFRDALERKKRERRNVRRTYTDAEELQARLDGRELERVPSSAPEFREPASAADFWDDMVIRHGSPLGGGAFRESPVLVAVAAAARESTAAAVAALSAARELDPAAQACVFANLKHWKAEPAAVQYGAVRVANQLLAEHERLDLAQEEDAEREAYRRAYRQWATA